jgi:uncharacterized protein YjiS (DUF1127 family)
MKIPTCPAVVPTVGASRLPASAGALFGAAARWMHATRVAWIAAVRRSREQRALSLLDDATLRDIGMRRSEIGSILAEAAGDAEMTRLRVASAVDTRLAPPVIRM